MLMMMRMQKTAPLLNAGRLRQELTPATFVMISIILYDEHQYCE